MRLPEGLRSKTLNCSNCHEEILEGRKFCRKCGTPNTVTEPVHQPESVRCSQCGSPILPNRSFCGACGNKLSSSDAYPPSMAEEIQDSRTVVGAESFGPVDGGSATRFTGVRVLSVVVALIILTATVLELWGVKLDVTTSPDSAQISLDGKLLGSTTAAGGSLVLPHVSRGQHTLTVTHAGSDTYSEQIPVGFFEMKHKVTIDLLAAKTTAEQTINTQSSPSSSAPSSESQQQLVLGVASIASVPSSENYSGEDWSVLKKLFPTLGWQSMDGYRDNPQEQPWPYAETAKAGDNLQITVMGARSIIFRSKVSLSWTEEHHDNLYIGKEFTPILCDTSEPSTYFERYFSVALPGKKPVYALYTYSEGASSPTGDETLTFGQDLKLPKPGDDADGGKWTASCQASPAKQSQASGQSAADQKIVSDGSTGPNGQPSKLVNGSPTVSSAGSAPSIIAPSQPGSPDFNSPFAVYSAIDQIRENCLKNGNNRCAIICGKYRDTLQSINQSLTGDYTIDPVTRQPRYASTFKQYYEQCSSFAQ